MIFEYVTAHNQCGGIGTVLTSVTIPANPDQVSTFANGSQTTGSATQFNAADLQNCPQNVSKITISGIAHDRVPNSFGGYDACQPDIVFPTTLWNWTAAEPAWSVCPTIMAQGWDPPRALKPVPGKNARLPFILHNTQICINHLLSDKLNNAVKDVGRP